MKFYNIYKKSIESLTNIENVVIEAVPNNNSIYEIKNYNILKEELISLKNIDFFVQYVNRIIDCIPVLVREKDKPQVDGSTRSIINNNINMLKNKMVTIIELYESFNLPKEDIGLDVLMPKFETIEEYCECNDDLKTIFKTYSLFKFDDKTIEYSFNDIGSSWISFSIDPSIIKDFLIILGLIINFSISFHHKIISLRLDKTLLERSELKNKILKSEIDFFDEMKKLYLDEFAEQLKNKDDKYKKIDKVEITSTIERCEKWFNKGLRFYAAIDIDEEIKKVFPITQESYKLELPKIHFIEDKQENDNRI